MKKKDLISSEFFKKHPFKVEIDQEGNIHVYYKNKERKVNYFMTDTEFMELCKQEVRKDYVIQTGKRITTDDIHIVWYCKTLQNWKALVSTNRIDGLYYECTYNGDKNELYIDVYTKIENVCISKEYKEYL